MLSEKAKSRAQQKLFGIVRSYQKGELENPSPEVEKIASTVSKSDVKTMASTKHKGLPERKKVEEAAFLASLGKMAMAKGKGVVKQKAKQSVKQKAANVAQGAIPQPNRDQVEEGAGRAAIGAGLGAMVGGPVGAAIGGSIGAVMGNKKKKVTVGGKKVNKKATNFFKAEPKITSSEGVVAFVKKGLERDKKAKDEKKIKNRKAVPYAALGASYQPEGEIVEGSAYGLWKGDGKRKLPGDKKNKKDVKEEVLDEVAPALAAVPAAAAKGVAVAGKVAVKGAAMAGKALAKGAQVAGKAASSAAKAAKPVVKSGLKAAGSAAKSVGKAGVEGLKSGAKTAGKTVAVAAGDAGANVVKSAGDAAAQRVKQRIAGSAIAASYEPELSIVDKMVMQYSPLTELNKRERVEAGQGKRAAKKGGWQKQKAKTGRRNINRFETGTVKRTESSGGRKPTYKTVTLPNPKSGYGKKDDHYNKNKITTQKLGAHGTASATEPGPQKHYSSGIVHHDSAQQQRRHEHQKRRGVKTKGTVAADIKKSLKENEVVSELKNSTLLSYTQKATNDLAFSGDGKKKAQKRATGIKTATGRLALRATDPDGSMGFNKNPKNEQIETLRKIVEEVGITSAAAMEKAREEAKLQAKEAAKVAEKKKKKVNEAKVDAGLSPEEKEKERNVRKFGVSHNVAGHGKLRRALHRSNRGDKKIPGDKSQYVETEAYRVLARDKGDKGRPAQFSYKDEDLANKFADSVRSKGGKATVAKEGVMDIVNRYRKKQKAEKKASMDSTTSKLHHLRKKKFKTEKQKEHEKYVNFLDADD